MPQVPQEFELPTIADAESDLDGDIPSPRRASVNMGRRQAPTSSTDGTPLLPPSEPLQHSATKTGHALLKIDLILLPFLCVLFLLNSLDRSNIGNAETANFTRDAGLKPEDLNTAVALFFVFFVALQPVGAAIGRKWGMAKYVPTVMTFWGVLTCVHIWIRRRWQLITVRILIGMLEG
jgi:hypothetical protein